MYGSDRENELTGNYIKDHWLGNLPLPLSYWINGSLISGVAALLAVGLASEIENENVTLQAAALGALALNIIVIIVWVWGVVGIWRSASRHEQRGGSPAWATVAKFMVIIGSLNTAGQLSKSSLQLIELSSLAVGSDPIGEPASLTANGTEAVLDGWVTSGTATRLGELLRTNPQIQKLKLSSQGGRIREAQEIAALVKSRQLSTEVEGQCASACTMIFLAADTRSFGVNSALGFHSPSGVGVSDDEAREDAPAMKVAYENAGLPNDFINKALNTPSSSMWYPTESELIAVGAINKFAASRIAHNHQLEVENIRDRGTIDVDQYTKAISASSDGRELTVVYQLSFAKRDINWNSVAGLIRKDSEEKICADRYLQMLVDSGAAYKYQYLDKGGMRLGEISIQRCP